jgi:dolichol-phosphate mannosyltransferase
MKTLVIIPTFNEASTVLDTINALLTELPEVDVLVVDDNSPDGTAQLVSEAAKSDSRISLISRPVKQGLGPAYLEGFQWAFSNGYDLIVEMDADGSHQAKDLKSMLSASRDADLVIGSRWVPGGAVLNWPWSRKLISRVGNLYARVMLGTNVFDMTSGFRVYRTPFLKKLVAEKVSSHGYSFQVELAYRAVKLGVVVEKPITFVERASGKSKMTLAIVLEALTKVTFWGIKRLF